MTGGFTSFWLWRRQSLIRHAFFFRRGKMRLCDTELRRKKRSNKLDICASSTHKSAGTLRSQRRYLPGKTKGQGGDVAPAAESPPLMLDADIRETDLGNESSQRASGRVRSFLKHPRQLGLHFETLHCSLHYLTTHPLPPLVGWQHAADPRFTTEN